MEPIGILYVALMGAYLGFQVYEAFQRPRRRLQAAEPQTVELRLMRVPIVPSMLTSLLQMDGRQHVAFEGLPADAELIDVAMDHVYGMVFAFVASKEFTPVALPCNDAGAVDLRHPKTAFRVPPLWIGIRDAREAPRSLEPSAN